MMSNDVSRAETGGLKKVDWASLDIFSANTTSPPDLDSSEELPMATVDNGPCVRSELDKTVPGDVKKTEGAETVATDSDKEIIPHSILDPREYLINYDPSKVVNDYIEPIVPNELLSEMDFALALPFSSKTTVPNKDITRVRTVFDDEIHWLSMEFLDEDGKGLTKGQWNMVIALFSLMDSISIETKTEYAKALKIDKPENAVFFQASVICEMFNLNVRQNTTRVLRDIVGLQKKVLKETRQSYSHSRNRSDKIFEPRIFSLITKSGSYKKTTTVAGKIMARGLHYVVFSDEVIQKFRKGLEVCTDRKKFLKLSGVASRIYFMLQAKRKLFGDIFQIELKEITSVSGIYAKRADRARARLELVLQEITECVADIRHSYIKGKNGIEVYQFVFTEEPENDVLPADKLYRELCSYYGRPKLEDLQLFEVSFSNFMGVGEKKLDSLIEGMSKEDRIRVESRGFIDLEKRTYKIGNNHVDIAELVMDVCLFQVIEKNYSYQYGVRKFFTAVIHKAVEGALEFPEGYNDFVTFRNEKIRAEERRNMAIAFTNRKAMEKSALEEKENELFEKYFETTFVKSKSAYQRAIRRAEEEIDAEIAKEVKKNKQTSIPNFREMRINIRVKENAKRDFINGDIVSSSNSSLMISSREIANDKRELLGLPLPGVKLNKEKLPQKAFPKEEPSFLLEQ